MKIRKIGCGCLVIIMAFFCAIIFINIFFNFLSEKESIDYKKNYIEETKDMALKTAKKYDLYPSVILAQSILESNWGRSELSRDYNNYFGIKEIQKDKAVIFETEEYVDGRSGKYLENFKKYSSKKASFNHYGKLLAEAKRYKNVKTAKNYKEAAIEIQKAGYATDPKYANKIISVIEKYNLYEYDNADL